MTGELYSRCCASRPPLSAERGDGWTRTGTSTDGRPDVDLRALAPLLAPAPGVAVLPLKTYGSRGGRVVAARTGRDEEPGVPDVLARLAAGVIAAAGAPPAGMRRAGGADGRASAAAASPSPSAPRLTVKRKFCDEPVTVDVLRISDGSRQHASCA